MRRVTRFLSRRRKICLAFFFFCLLSTFFFQIFFSTVVQSSIFIVSLTTTVKRFHYELPLTIHSLLSQTLLPREIRIYLPASFNQTGALRSKISSKKLKTRFDKIVRFQFVDVDEGPATKFLPILREFQWDKNQPIIICDDDHIYHPNLLSTLNLYSEKFPNEILGFRGWRIREDLQWGVSSAEEYFYHVVYSHRIREIYRVGIITANSAYLIRPRFFDENIYSNFSEIADEIRHVDDIWLNGHAARRNVSRFVIPSDCPNLSVTVTHELENYFQRQKTTRSTANDRALAFFSDDWEKNLWFRYKGENHPNYRHFIQTIVRESFCALWKLRIIFQFGKVF